MSSVGPRDKMFDAEKSTAALMGVDTYDLLTEIASKIPAGADGLLFHPYLGGERAPIWDANARGSFFGLTHNHTRPHGTCRARRYHLQHLHGCFGP